MYTVSSPISSVFGRTGAITATSGDYGSDEITNDTDRTGADLTTALNTDLLTEDTTVNLTSTQTAAQIQALIDAQPKNLNGYILTFQFGDGTYTIATQLSFTGFHGGTLNIYGNTTETNATILHTTQAVHLNASTISADNVIFVDTCACWVYTRNLKITVPDVANCAGIEYKNVMGGQIRFNYTLGTAKTTSNVGIAVVYSDIFVGANYVSNTTYGIQAVVARVSSSGNDDTGTAPNYGLEAIFGSTIGKDGTQPAGTTANENTASGGVIR